MKKFLLICLLFVTASQLTKAQNTTATGSVKDDKGSPLHNVFVADMQYKTATFSDSLGNFTIAVHPDSKLQLQLAGYESASVTVANNASPQVVLKSTGAASPQPVLSAQAIAQGTGNGDAANLAGGGTLAPGHQKGATHGNRYLLDNFAHGYIINASDELVYKPNFLLDYDKMDGAILQADANKTMTQLSYDQIKSFTLFSDKDVLMTFEKAPAIDPSHYVQVIASGKKYKIYKLIKTKFVKSDYVNTGVASHGNDYDEFIDDADYYFLDVQANQPKKLSLKKKSIKENFAKDADKVNKYLSDNSGDIDDVYLSKLGDYMNQ
jgi:hypothetical protein